MDRDNESADGEPIKEYIPGVTASGRDYFAATVTSAMPAPHGAAIFAGVPFTERELEILPLLADGLTDRAIGHRLCISPRTASWHISNMLTKADRQSRAALAAFYARHTSRTDRSTRR